MCRCGHATALHHLPIGGCRINGCPCERLTVPGQRPADDGDPQRVSFVVPPGYAVHVVLVPPGAALDDPALDLELPDPEGS